MSIPGIQACSAFWHDVAPVCGRFLLETGLTRKRFVPSIRQNGSERKGGAERFTGCYLLSLAAVFRRGYEAFDLRQLYPECSICIPTGPDCADGVWRAILSLPPKTVEPEYQPQTNT